MELEALSCVERISNQSKEKKAQPTTETDAAFTRVGEEDRAAVEAYAARLHLKQRKIVSSLVQWSRNLLMNPNYGLNGPSHCSNKTVTSHIFRLSKTISPWASGVEPHYLSGKDIFESTGMKMAHVKVKRDSWRLDKIATLRKHFFESLTRTLFDYDLVT